MVHRLLMEGGHASAATAFATKLSSVFRVHARPSFSSNTVSR
jgi:hypothetical protein